MKNITYWLSLVSVITGLHAVEVLADSAVDPATPSLSVRNEFVSILPSAIPGNIIEKLNHNWMLISAGTETNFNGMTASWGGLGVWNTPVAFILVHPKRHTYSFIEREECFTLSFFDDKYRPALTLFGTKSGRDIDKTKAAGLTAMSVSNSVAYAEADLILLCKKRFSTPTSKDNPNDSHTLFFGDIVNVWKRK
mgnify:CR=1 FL=1